MKTKDVVALAEKLFLVTGGKIGPKEALHWAEEFLSDMEEYVNEGHEDDEAGGKSAAGEVAYSPQFLVFWRNYPKKVGKGAAYAAWKKGAKSVGGEARLIDMVRSPLLTAKGSEAWRKDNGQFIPNPATWLNQRRWEDGDEEAAG